MVDPHGFNRIHEWLAEDTTPQIRIFVDSEEGVTAADGIFGTAAVALEVLIDIGVAAD